jgi:exopolyphosphatase / guanosine-5'-triphosphate,3'-diphosphate pyrophosphatase
VTRVAAVDIGTNSTRLLIAEVREGRIVELDRRSTVTRLGEGVDAGRLLLPEPIERTLRVLGDYHDEVEAQGVERTLAVATSAVRDAGNGRAFLDEIKARYGFATRLLSGEEEAEFTRRGLGALGASTLLVDVGGGSTELSLGEFRTSLDVGSVRLTERFLPSDPPTSSEQTAASEFVRSLLPDLRVEDAVGVAGTVTQLHLLIGELTLGALERELEQLASLPLERRAQLPGMDPARAPVIVAGALIVVEVLRRYGLSRLVWSVHDLLDGVALEAARMS